MMDHCWDNKALKKAQKLQRRAYLKTERELIRKRIEEHQQEILSLQAELNKLWK